MKHTVYAALVAFFAFAQSVSAGTGITVYTSGNNIMDICRSGTTIACATDGGMVLWDTGTMSYKKYTTMDGLPSNDIRAVAESPDGRIFCATGEDGLAVFSGTAWTAYSGIPSTFQSHAQKVRDFITTPDSTFWMAGGNGVLCLKNGVWSCRDSLDGLPAGAIKKLATGSDGSIAFGSSRSGVGVFDGASKKIFTMKDGLPDNDIDALAMTDAKNIWVGTKFGAAMYDGVSWKKFTTDDGLLSIGVMDIYISPDGKVYIATKSGVSIFSGGSFSRITTDQWPSYYSVNCIFADDSGIRWYGTNYGLTKEKDGVFSVYRTTNEPGWNTIWDSALATDGSIWFATFQSVFQYSRGSWILNSPTGNAPGNYCSIATGSDGSVWVGSFTGSVARYKDGKWTSFGPDDGVLGGKIGSIAVDTEGVAWCASQSAWPNGLCYYKNGKWTQVTTDEGLASSLVTSLAIETDNSVWAGTDKGLSHFSVGKWVTYTTKEGLPDNTINNLHMLKDNTVVISTQKGIVFFDGTKFTPLGHAFINSVGINKIIGDTRDTIRLATTIGVFEPYSGNIWTLYTTYTDGYLLKKTDTRCELILPSPNIQTIVADRNGDIWCGTYHKGIFTIDFEPSAIGEKAGIPTPFAVTGNHPNPFNPSTTIEYALPSAGKASLAVYSITGQKVRELVSGILPAGKHSAVWDGRDDRGRIVSSGVYLSRLTMGGISMARRMLLVR